MMIEEVKDSVLKEILPDAKKTLKEASAFLKKLDSLIKKKKIKAIVMIGGSVAKDTYIKGDHDCDIFVRFDKSYKDEDISSILGSAIKTLKPELLHGSRDYYHVKGTKGMNYEIVPVIHITNPKDAVNVTDMSPLHVEWVKKHPNMNNEIRLAKQFCKACGVYGAESYIKGFSGHVLDILVIYTGGFIELLKATQIWKDKEVIDTEKYYKKDAAMHELNSSKTDSPIIIIDPVLPQRNAAAALSYEKLELFKKKAAEFLKNPTTSAFEIKEKKLSDLKKEAGKNKLITLNITTEKGKEDVIGARLLKAFQQIKNQIKFYDFKIIDAGWKWGKQTKAMFWYIIDPDELFPIVKWVGPPLYDKERTENFKKKYEKTFIENERICTYIKRKFTKPEDLVDSIIKNDEYIYEKVKKVERI